MITFSFPMVCDRSRIVRAAGLCLMLAIAIIPAMAEDTSPATNWLKALGPVPALAIPVSKDAWPAKRTEIGAIGDKGGAGELSASKFNVWAGRTLWGVIVRDDLMALDYLCSRPEVDAVRIGVTGISMGSTRAWWIMALDDRPRAAVCIACMTRYQELIAHGMIKAHGIYYFVPGMLKHFDAEAVIACAAPRPMLFQTGDKDGGSPVDGVRTLGEIVSKVYALHGNTDHFENVIYPGVAHVYLPEMWAKTVAWMDRWVKAP